MSKKYTIEYVKQYFKDNNCELLEKEYKNNRTKIKYRCICGNISKITFGSFLYGNRCKKCGTRKIAEKTKHSYKYIGRYFKNNGCILLSEFYTNAFEMLSYICECGHISKITFNNFQRNHRCNTCSTKKVADKKRFSYKFVKEYFNDHNCILLSKSYKNIFEILEYTCECEDNSKISFNDFKLGRRCKKCGIQKRSGENNCNYNPNITDEERRIKRNYEAYRVWRRDVYSRDDYTCQCCLKRGARLNAHHIKNYYSNKELRIDKNNGVTLCKCCHIEFHKKYGNRNNNSCQVDEFLKLALV